MYSTEDMLFLAGLVFLLVMLIIVPTESDDE